MTGRPGPPLGGTGTWRQTTWRRGARAALDGGLERPSLWPPALLAFLLRGGWFVVVLPIVVVPSTVGVATFIGPTAVTPAGPAPSLVALIAGVLVAAVAWLLAGGLVAAAAEAALIRASLEGAPFAVAGEGAAPATAPPERLNADSVAAGRTATTAPPGVTVSLAARILAARLLAALPLAVALGWAIPRTVGAAYAELVSPTDPAVALPLRVLWDIPEAVTVVLVAWLLGEAVGGIAARRVLLFGEGPVRADVRAVGHLVGRPVASLATMALTLVGSGAIAIPALALAAAAWERLGRALRADADPVAVALLAVLFVAGWGSGLALAGATAAWRSLAWTAEVLRAQRGSGPQPRHESPEAGV